MAVLGAGGPAEVFKQDPTALQARKSIVFHAID
jgi:hypothetical protein